MNVPRGLVTRILPAERQRFAAIRLLSSESLRSQHGVYEIHQQRRANDQHNDRSKTHIRLNARARRKPHMRATPQRIKSSPPEISSPASQTSSQNLTMISMSINCSSLRRSGNHTVLPCAPQAVCAPLRVNDPDVLPSLQAKNSWIPIVGIRHSAEPGGVTAPFGQSSTAHSHDDSRTPSGK